jgi:alkylhydroperoxidase family enzyme
VPQFADQGVDEELYAHVGDWAAWSGFDDRQRLAIEYAERFALDHDSITPEVIARMRAHFSDEEILDLGISVGSWMAYGRLTRVLGADRACDPPGEA